MNGNFFELLKRALHEWSEDKAPRLGAALAYYSIFSVGPLIVLVIGAASLIFGADAARGKVVDEIKGTVGEPVAQALEQMLAHGRQSGWGAGATILGLTTLLFGAAGVFGQLQDALNTIWKVAPKPGRGIRGMIRDRFLSLTMVLGTGFLLLISLVLTAALSAIGAYFGDALPGIPALWQALNQAFSFAVITVLFAMIFRILPDAQIAWRDVWIGAILTSALFNLGKFLLGWYLGREGVASGFGAAGSLVMLLLWVYYSSLILLFGAEFTRVYAQRYGAGIKPTPNAVALSETDQARQGMARRQKRESSAMTNKKRVILLLLAGGLCGGLVARQRNANDNKDLAFYCPNGLANRPFQNVTVDLDVSFCFLPIRKIQSVVSLLPTAPTPLKILNHDLATVHGSDLFFKKPFAALIL